MKNFFYSLIVVFVTLLIAELVLRAFVDLPDPYAHLRVKSKSSGEIIRLQNPRNDDFYFIFEPTELYPTDAPNIIPISINNYGFRHEDDIEESKKEVRIFALGGSTTQNYDYQYEETWTQVLEKKLESDTNIDFDVYNGGTAGSALIDHIALLQNRVIHLKPDYIILFVGINDLNLLLGDDNPYRFQDIFEQSEGVSWYKLALGKFTLYKLGLNVITKLNNPSTANAEKKENPRDAINPKIPEGAKVLFTSHITQVNEAKALPMADFPGVDYAYYKGMVASFIGSCQANGIPVLVITQPTTWDTQDEGLAKSHWMNKNRENRFPKEDMQAAMDSMNTIVHELCKELNVPNLKPESFMQKTTEYFYDDCHFTPKGSKMLGDSLTQFIKRTNFIKTK